MGFLETLQGGVNDEIQPVTDPKFEELKKLEVGSRLHDNWRAPRKKEDGTYEPRMKPTSDAKWIEAHGADQVDIANTSFENLPADWQEENLLAGREAVDIVRDATTLDEATIREASIKVHDAWVARKKTTIAAARKAWAEEGLTPDEVEAKVNDKFGWDMKLMVPFDEIPVDEQVKDTDHVLAVLQVNREIEAGEITKSSLASKFGREVQEITD